MGIGRRQLLRAALVASIAGGAPSSTWALLRRRNPLTEGLRATRAIGTLVPPGSPGLVRGVIAHEAISLAQHLTLFRRLPAQPFPRAVPARARAAPAPHAPRHAARADAATSRAA